MSSSDSPKLSNCLFLFLLFIPLYLLTFTGGGFLHLIGGAGAVGIVFFLPGVFLPPLLFPRRRLDFFSFLSWAVGLNWLFWLIATTAIKSLGGSVTRTSLLAVLIPASLIAALFAYPRLQSSSITTPLKKRLILWGAITGGLLLFALLRFQPFLAGEDRFWPNRYHKVLADLELEAETTDPPLIEWRENKTAGGTVSGWTLTNPTNRPIAVPLLFFFDGREEMEVELTFNRETIYDSYFPPPYEITSSPRNYPPAKDHFAGRALLPPGESVLALRFLTAGGVEFDHPPLIIVRNYSRAERGKLQHFFSSEYLIGDTGDLREQLNLARNLKTGIIPYTYSYNGTLFDGGGYTIEHPLFPFFLKMMLLALWEDSLRSFQLLFWGLLAFLAYVLLAAVTEEADDRLLLPGSLVGIVLVLYLLLVRYRIDTPYISTTLSLTVLLALFHLSCRRTFLFLLWAAFAVLCKGGAAFIFLGLLAYALAFRDWKYPIKSAAAVAAIGLLALAPTFLATFRKASPEAWEILFAGNYGQRLTPLRALIGGDLAAARFLGESALRYLWLVSAGSVFTAAFWFIRKKPRNVFLILAALFSFFLVALSKPSLIAEDFSGHRLSYLAPVTFLVFVGGVSLLARRRGPGRKKLAVLALLLALPAFASVPLILQPYRQALAGASGEISPRVPVIDFLLRRYRESGGREDRRLLRKELSRLPSVTGEGGRRLYREIGGRLEKAGLGEDAEKLFRKAYPPEEGKAGR